MSKKKKFQIVFATGIVNYSQRVTEENNRPNCQIVEKEAATAKDAMSEAISERYFQRMKQRIDEDVLYDWMSEALEIEGGLYLEDDVSDVYVVEK